MLAQPRPVTAQRAALLRRQTLVRAEVGEGAEGRRVLFNTIAPVYDTLNDVLSVGLHRAWKAAAVQWAALPRGGAALDVCCGSGDLALRLSEAVGPSGSVVGLDFAEAQLERAAQRESERRGGGAASIRWLQGDAVALPFPDRSFDGATCGYGLRNVVDQAGALRELARVLRPAARLAVLDFNHSESPLTTAVQSAFLDSLVVPAARLAGAEAEYAYLKSSIAAYPTGLQLVVLAKQAGFAEASYYELAGGLMGCLVASAPGAGASTSTGEP